ncbi:MAG TPA: DapH/DapD/GlmU-related protein [Coleofasciculaceae cyanobacterium]
MFSPLPLCISLLPAKLKPFFYRRILGWKIGKNVSIGLSYIDGQHISIGDNVTIGHFNIIATFRYLEIGSSSLIKNFNHFSGRCDHPKWPGYMKIGEKVNIMSRHFIDSHGEVVIGDRTTLAGRDTQIWSHSLTYQTEEPMLSPMSIKVGKEVYIGARSTLIGCQIPDQAVVGAGSIITKDFSQETGRILIAGNPGVVKKRYKAATVSVSS